MRFVLKQTSAKGDHYPAIMPVPGFTIGELPVEDGKHYCWVELSSLEELVRFADETGWCLIISSITGSGYSKNRLSWHEMPCIEIYDDYRE